MEHFDFDVIGGAIAAILAVVYVVRMEGKIDLLTEILNRVEAKVDEHVKRYNQDGLYSVIEHKRRPSYPAE